MAFKLTLILGTARTGRQSEKVAMYLLKKIKERNDLEVTLADAKDFIHGHTIPPWESNEATKPWRDLVKATDGFLIVLPEYNHSYPPELKMLLDQDLENYAGKPVGFASVSAGGFGGVRAIEQIVPVLRRLALVPLFADLNFSKVEELFEKPESELDEKYAEKVTQLVDQIVGFSKAK
ncbi:MAG: NAD(P)H-dependent oxidoreductase [Candidatus Peribacteraceae bacterium]|nr:NAD(P)H-dependent oxidoreductase [Candidatus Peribacteraceae bacterium]